MDILDIRAFLHKNYSNPMRVDSVLDELYKENLSYRIPYNLEIVYYNNKWSLEDTESNEIIVDEEVFELEYIPFKDDGDFMSLRELKNMFNVDIECYGDADYEEDKDLVVFERCNAYCIGGYIFYIYNGGFVAYNFINGNLSYELFKKPMTEDFKIKTFDFINSFYNYIVIYETNNLVMLEYDECSESYNVRY